MPTDAPRYALEALFGTQAAELINHIPHCKRLGMEVVQVGPREATVKLPYRDELIGDPVRRVVFGGVITTLLDHASGLAVFCSLPELTAIATLDLRIDYLKAAAARKSVFGRATCYKMTRNVAFTRAVAYQDDLDDVVAHAVGTFMLSTKSGRS